MNIKNKIKNKTILRRRVKKRPLTATPKKLFNPLRDCTVKIFMLVDVEKSDQR